MDRQKRILATTLGNCIHISGVSHFLKLAEEEGYETIFLGPCIPLDEFFNDIERLKPDLVAVSYRLTPSNVVPILEELAERKSRLSHSPLWVFGGTKPVADIARKFKIFSFISDGFDEPVDSVSFLKGRRGAGLHQVYSDNLLERISQKQPSPILRCHFGLPAMEETVRGIEKIAESKILDVISLGPDQNAQQFFFKQSCMDNRLDGAGGVPVRSREDFLRLKEASKRGNFPLMRCYSGTEDVFLYAQLLMDTIDNAWAAIPLSWYSTLDGRGNRPLEQSVPEAHRLIRWHAERGIPVEINEPHQWAMRDAHDAVVVATAYLSAYHAKKLGVKNYISQYMFNVPFGETFTMDLARVLAMKEMVESLEDQEFKTYRETRAGLPLFHADLNIAKGQLAASTFMQMAVRPHIMHVVSFCEAEHAATAQDIIESCGIVRGVIRHAEAENPYPQMESVLRRKEELISEANVILDFIRQYFSMYEDPLSSPDVLVRSIKLGILDAGFLMKDETFRGHVETKILDGKCVAYDKDRKAALSEKERLERLDLGTERRVTA